MRLIRNKLMNKWTIIFELKSGIRNRHFSFTEISKHLTKQYVLQKEEAEDMSGTLLTWTKFMDQQLYGQQILRTDCSVLFSSNAKDAHWHF